MPTKPFVIHLVIEADDWRDAWDTVDGVITEHLFPRADVVGCLDPEQCYICHGCGITEVVGWDYGKDCSCAAGNPPPPEFNGMHEPHCGLQPCPVGCPSDWEKWENRNRVAT